MTTVTTSNLSTTFQISFPSSKDAGPTFQITATRVPGRKPQPDVFKIMAVLEDGTLIAPTGKFAPKLHQSNELRKSASLELDKLEREQTPAVEVKKEKKEKPNFTKATSKTDAATSTAQTDHTAAHVDKMGELEIASGTIKGAKRKTDKVSPEEKMTHANEQRLELANDLKNLEEALAPKTKADKPAPAPKPAAITFDELKTLVAAGKVSHRSGKAVTEYVGEGKTDFGNDYAKLKLDNGKTAEILLSAFHAWYRISA